MFKRKCVGKRSSVTKESVQEFFRLQDVINAYRGTSNRIRGVPSCSKENVLGKDYLLKRNQYKNFHDVINAYRGTSNRNPWCSLMFKRKCVGKRSTLTKELVQEFFSTTGCNKCLQRN